MKKAKNELPTRLEAGGVCFQGHDWGNINVARIRFPAGADATPLLEGLPNNLCQCPHWGMVIKGSIHVTYTDGAEETVNAGEVYYWPPGHTVRVDEDYRVGQPVQNTGVKRRGDGYTVIHSGLYTITFLDDHGESVDQARLGQHWLDQTCQNRMVWKTVSR